jgi:hypothetical protein
MCREGTAKVTPLWRARKAPRESGGGRCYVVVPRISDPWLATVPDLAARLEHDGFVLWRGAHCAIYELPKIGRTRDLKPAPTEPPRVEVVEVARANPTKERARGKIDAPPAGSLVDPSKLRLVGWALGHDEPVSEVEVEAGGGVIWRGPAGVERPDVRDAFPDRPWASKAGFRGEIDIREAIAAAERFELEVNAVLAGGERIRIGSLRGRRRPGDRRDRGG